MSIVNLLALWCYTCCMQIDAWISNSANKLSEADIESAQLDAELLVSGVIAQSRTWLHSHPEHKLTNTEQQKLDELLQRRLNHEPLAYILGFKEFYGREFAVTPDVLVPRPESEGFIDIIKTLSQDLKFIDIGTGSGCLAISIALEQPSWSGTATDISREALNVAKQNARNLKAKNLVFKVQNLLVGDDGYYDLMIANLPYVPNNLRNKSDIKHEPEIALFADHDGLALYQELFQQLRHRKHQPTHILTESLLTQHQDLEKLASNAGYRLGETRGLIQHFVPVSW